MLTRALAFAAFALLSACGQKNAAPAGGAPDLIIVGGPIYTGLGEGDRVEAVAVKDGRVLAVGTRSAISATATAKTETIDLAGAALYPGFVDAHAHLLGIGLRELTLNLEGVSSIDELVDIVAAEVEGSEPGDVIYGRGWIETGWDEARFPTRADLDPASPDNPVILYRADGHALVANSAALVAAKVTRATKDPQGGRIERDSRGEPTGVLIDGAMGLVETLIEAPSEEEKAEAYAAGASVYAGYGWTGLHNMSVDPADVALIERLAGSGDAPIRVYNALDPAGMDWLAENAPHTDATGRVITRAVKLYSDGALGSRGAALNAPYTDKPETSGLLLTEEKDMLALLERARDEGVQVATHAIGDRANRLVLDWYETTLKDQAASPRWRIEHAQIVDPADIPRFGRDKVIASMQPSHAISDMFFAPARLGPDRLAGAYAWKSLVKSGAVIAGGSDAPVERGDPLIEFYAAVSRRALDGFQGPDWGDKEKLTRAEALRIFTAAPAFASFQEDELGTIEPGKRADFTAFTRDIMTIPEADILKARPALTVVDGKVIFRKGETNDEP
jgi:hypothetical protein